MRGAGTSTCAVFAKQYAQKPDLAEDQFFDWAQGYLSGLNMRGKMDKSPDFQNLHGDIESQKQYIRDYCNGHPLALYMDAVDALYLSLPMTKAVD